MTQAYPLQWPAGWPRMSAGGRKRAKFSKGERQYSNQPGGGSWVHKKELSIWDATKRIQGELTTMGVRDGLYVISTNLELRNDGLPRSGQRAPEDPGVAVYWTRKGQQQVMAIDLYDRVQDNMAAIAASLNALRAIERHGGAQILDRAFAGFTALANPDSFDPWAVLGLRPGATKDDIERKYRELARAAHPDTGGSHEAFTTLQRARTEALARP
jgi:hypothetical protein